MQIGNRGVKKGDDGFRDTESSKRRRSSLAGVSFAFFVWIVGLRILPPPPNSIVETFGGERL